MFNQLYNLFENFLDIYPTRFGILVLQFLLPIFLMFVFLYFLKNHPFKKFKIKPREPNSKFVLHEIKYTLLSFVLLTVIVSMDLVLIKQDFTRGYLDINQYGISYFIFSILILLFLYDVYFYVAHRIFHSKNVYKIIHKTHHRSPAITPFGAFSISFLEGLFEFIFLPTMIFLIPLHPLALSIFLSIYILFNSYVHSGYEILPKFWVKTPILKYINTAVHHDLHHSKLKYNFTLFLNIWDRIFKTQFPEYEAEFIKIKEQSKPNPSS